MTRFLVETRGTVHFNLVDSKQPRNGGLGIIANSHSKIWADTIVAALNYCDAGDHTGPTPTIPQPPETGVPDNDT